MLARFRQIGDPVVKRQAVHRFAAAAERDAGDDRRACADQSGNLVAGVSAGRIDHHHAPGLGVEKRQALGPRHANISKRWVRA